MNILPRDTIREIISNLGDSDLLSLRLCSKELYLVEVLDKLHPQYLARNGKELSLKYILDYDPDLLSQELVYCAARGGHLNILQDLVSRGLEVDHNTCANSARGGHIELLKWLRDQDCPWNHTVPRLASRYNHHEVLIWAIKNGCEYDRRSNLKYKRLIRGRN